MSNRTPKNTVKGFSLGEVILAAAVLTVGILPVLGAMTGAFSTSSDSRYAIVATGLAQEGMELVMNVRDNGFLCKSSGEADCQASGGFMKFPNDRKYCRIDYDGNNNNNNNNVGNDDVFLYDTNANRNEGIQCRSNAASPPDRYFDLQLNASGFFRITNNATEEQFKRQIIFDYDGSASYDVYSVVTWGGWRPIVNVGSMQNDTVAQVISMVRSDCIVANRCVFVGAKLSAWK